MGTHLKQTRGDTAGYNFQRKNAQNVVITTEPQALYFTVKERWTDKSFLLQKRMNEMTMDADGTWHFTIQSFDTDNLPYGDYVYDVEAIDNDAVQTIAKGKFTLTVEATWKINQ